MADRAGLGAEFRNGIEFMTKLAQRTRGDGSRVVIWLVSIVLFAILASNVVGLLVVSKFARLREARLAIEAQSLFAGMERFKEKFGQFPPNFDDDDAVMRFVKSAFPKFVEGVSSPPPKKLDAARALVFWLSELGSDPADPFAWNPKEQLVFFDFPSHQIEHNRFYSEYDYDEGAYVYFHHASYETVSYHDLRPYRRGSTERPGEYFAPTTIQIIGSGKDCQLGRGGLITELSKEDRDNVVSFSTNVVGDIDLNEK